MQLPTRDPPHPDETIIAVRSSPTRGIDVVTHLPPESVKGLKRKIGWLLAAIASLGWLVF